MHDPAVIEGLTKLEQAVLDKLLQLGNPTVEALRLQAEHSRVRHREYTGVGFWTEFDVSEVASSAGSADFELSGVGADIPGLEHGAGFLLFVRNGYLSQLEGFTYDEPWPQDDQVFRLKSTVFQFGDEPSPDEGQVVGAIGEVLSKPDLFRAIAAALAFPGWFGWNWDALHDCLRDLSWMPAVPVVIYHATLPGLPMDDLSIYLDILSDAARFWQAETRFWSPAQGSRLTIRFAPQLEPAINAVLP
ncbi:MAG: barstar family protein [Candidatus Limnocylindria bacterium]